LLKPHLSIHPITYNDYLTETVQDIQGDRHDRAFDSLSLESGGYTSESAQDEGWPKVALDFLQALKDDTQPNVEEYSVSLAADVAVAYYKVETPQSSPLEVGTEYKVDAKTAQVALKKFTDDVSVNAVETCVIQECKSTSLILKNNVESKAQPYP
jgi:hypothetical protein